MFHGVILKCLRNQITLNVHEFLECYGGHAIILTRRICAVYRIMKEDQKHHVFLNKDILNKFVIAITHVFIVISNVSFSIILHFKIQIMDESDRKKIVAIEKLLTNDKPWQLKGEVGTHSRPANSLLFEEVNFERRTKAPELTDKSIETLESMIIQRIKDGKFDDPARKVKPALETARREVEVSSEKSKVGLAQLYEQELLSKVTDKKTKQGPETIVEIKLAALIRKLDALSEGC